MTTSSATAGLPTSSKWLCATYSIIAIAALIATWSQNLAYIGHSAHVFSDFVNDTKVTPASRSITVDILLFFLAAAILMVIEARKHDVRFVWAYILGASVTAISFTFPLFLIAREVRLSKTDRAPIGRVDAILLAGLAVAIASTVVWVDAA